MAKTPRNLNEKEERALEITANLWACLNDLEELHPSDIVEACRDIHNIQNRIMARPIQRIKNESKDATIS